MVGRPICTPEWEAAVTREVSEGTRLKLTVEDSRRGQHVSQVLEIGDQLAIAGEARMDNGDVNPAGSQLIGQVLGQGGDSDVADRAYERAGLACGKSAFMLRSARSRSNDASALFRHNSQHLWYEVRPIHSVDRPSPEWSTRQARSSASFSTSSVGR